MIAIDTSTGTLTSSIDLKGEACAVSFNDILCIGYKTGVVIMYEDLTLTNPLTLLNGSQPLIGITLTKNGKLLAALENTVKLIDLSTKECKTILEQSIKNCLIDSKGQYAAAILSDGSVSIYNIGGIKLIKEFKVNAVQVTWSSDSKYLFITDSNTIKCIETDQWAINEIAESGVTHIEYTKKNIIALVQNNVLLLLNHNTKTKLASVQLSSKPWQLKFQEETNCLAILTNINIELINLPEELFKEYKAGEEFNTDKEFNVGKESSVDKEQDANQGKDINKGQGIDKKQDVNREKSINKEKDIDEERNVIGNKDVNKEQDVEMTKVVKARKTINKIGINVGPQEQFQVNATQYVDDSRFLCWNTIGNIKLIKGLSATSIEFEFTDGVNKNFFISDEYEINIGTLNSLGGILASSGNTEKESVIQFVSFNKGLTNWTYKLPLNEYAELVAIGIDWIAVYTSEYYVRVFSLDGLQLHVFCIEAPVVTICAYRNLLAIVYHHSIPIYNIQKMNIRIINIKHSFNVVADIALPMAKGSLLKWIGFSEEGQLFTLDTSGIIRAFNGNIWIPMQQQQGDLWIASIKKGVITGFEGENIKKDIKLSIPVLEGTQFEEEYILKSFVAKKEPYETLIRGHSTIEDDEEFIKVRKGLDIMLMDKIRECCLDNSIEKAMTYAEMMSDPATLSITITLCQKLDKNELADRISTIMEVLLI